MNINSKQYIGKAIFVTATNTDVGKTYACEKLLNFFAKEGLKVGYFKPIETGVINNQPFDGTKLFNLACNLNSDYKKLSIKDVVPYQFTLPASPYVAKGNTFIDIDFLKKQKDYLLSFCDILIVEGAGGLMVPIEIDYFMIDLIKEFNTKAFLIGPSNLGCINDILLSMNALKNKDIDFDFFINLYKDLDSFEKVTKPFLEDYFKRLSFL
ncbi:dethiobiotin synthase [Arcobacter porcinus]|uniref:ATP-dependent dethiobiotin synthetase BioD n=1 Tax=Arcobacter porcinus TaxID=1935204 RepID=A0A1C0B1D9_9BACT|nr:dethiobiotin synthase [Arcobacter porcinus]OCL89912.1 ATP-dependent dethiobiotin synthetase BioD [Aliarcobacter thereius]OCL83032.1 ATP-dependent dethiobiotin synthetase BioD [Arcobacter porcinus]OCL84340.1 ATP-dependent dethiobiotin synthetase BioD [Arcobacter porcinus]OCL88880.1 ATP-dependent dethiobiotin synthetase BioD [Arcobacter porcinus]OCL93678.1 ATP-dependent dethiobiotin synthetase BioD [Arcobacter porcinus]